MTIKGNVKLLLQKELHTPKYFIIFICESSAKIPDVYLSVCNYTLQTLPCTSTTIKSVTCPSKQAQNTQHFIWPNRKSKNMVMCGIFQAAFISKSQYLDSWDYWYSGNVYQKLHHLFFVRCNSADGSPSLHFTLVFMMFV